MRYPNLGEMMTIQAKRWKNKPLVYFEDKVYTCRWKKLQIKLLVC